MGRTAREKAFRWGAATVAALAVATAVVPATAVAAPVSDDPGPQRVGAAPRVPQGAVRTADPAPGKALELSVVLEPRDADALKRFVAEVSTPGSPRYRQYLGTGEFAKVFGAEPATVARVRAELEAKGLTVGALEADGLTLPVTTTVAKAGEAFSTQFDGYRLTDGTTGLVNTTAPALDGRIADEVRTVGGLSTLGSYKPLNTGAKAKPRKKGAEETGAAQTGPQPRLTGTTPAMCGDISTLFATATPGYPAMLDTRDYWAPRSLATQYNMANQPNVQTGTTIAVYSLENYDARDNAEFQRCFRTKVPVTSVRVNGGPSGAATDGVGLETALDVQTIIGQAPQSKILVYQGKNTWNDGTAVYRQIVNENRAKVISVSWGLCELNTPTSAQDAENLIFQQAAAQGQTVVVASGDNGSTGCFVPDDNGNPTSGVPNQNQLAVDFPSASPYVLAVGGTTMKGSVSAQTTWVGSGGGVSRRYTVPAGGFQSAVSGAGYTNACATASGTCRQVPDVAGLADYNTGYPVAYGAGQYWNIIGGTSGAAPVWAALIGQANQDLACQANGAVGYVHPALYKLSASAFRDVTTGHNNVTQSGNYSGLYKAGAGYDLATGLGAPNGREIVAGLCKAVAPSPAATFNALTPARVLDTRYGIGRAGTTPVAANGTVKLKVSGVGGVPATGVTSVVMNVTAVSPSAPGFLIAYPSGTTRPSSSNMNWLKGQIVPNLVTVPVGKDGTVSLYNAGGGTTHFIADISGYFSTATGGGTYLPTGPARILDTRYGIGRAGNTPVDGKGTVALTVAGSGGVPATGATSVVLNVTATAPKSTGHLIAYPGGATRPTASNINWLTGQTRPNMVVLPIGPDGTVNLYNAGLGSVHFIADVFGYYTAGAEGASFHSAGPARLLDTRYALGAASATPMKGGVTQVLNLNDGHTLANAKAVVLNVTVTAPSSGGFLTVWPDGTTLPNASNINWTAGQTVANLVTVPVVNGKIDFRPNAGNVHVIADLFGYYS
ncbi:protease pro-enzyme activation domain-containing protein [Streptomyces sp. NPDC093111]|uniref:protease pro-enzyme activation domain-containing protein n=1 Tax=Streptomyces sp. NPDC093111 TaxID=3154978 RepID=UPI00341400F0